MWSKIIGKEKYLILPFWGMLFVVLWIQTIPQTQSFLQASLFSLVVLASVYPFTTYLSENLLQKAMRNKSVWRFVIQFLGISVVIGIICGLWTYSFYILEKNGIFPSSEYFKMHMPAYYMLVFLSSGLAINMCICGVQFFKETLKLRKSVTEYELQNLRHRVTPHFMFNVLNHIHILMQTDVELASDLLIKYADILRYQLYNDEKRKVKISQDVQFVKDFIAVEKLRWQDKIQVSSHWHINNPNREIPAFLFITFVENAFKHVSHKNEKKGFIDIAFEQTEQQIVFTVKNSVSKTNTNGLISTNLGLENLKERLDILFYKNYDLAIDKSNAHYKAELVLNL